MEEIQGSEVLVPGGRWAWLQLIGVLAGTVVAVMNAVRDVRGEHLFWWVLALVGVGYALATTASMLARLSRRPHTMIRVDGYGLDVPGHGLVAWSQVENVTTVWGEKPQNHWWVILRDGTALRTGFEKSDRQLRRRWDAYVEARHD